MSRKKVTKKNVTLAALAAAVVVAIGAGGTFAYFTDQADAKNTITTGKVDIRLDEPLFDQATENRTMTGVMPGQEITKDPTITVAEDSNSVYLRAAITIEGLSQMNDDATDATYQEELENALQPSLRENGWEKSSDGYYYLSESKKAGASVPIFTTFTIPKTWNNQIAGKTFTIKVQAEAIQSENFTPQYDEKGHIISWLDSGEKVIIETYPVSVGVE
ncbi:MAG: SipW-dependent-type signal peptide-containing protein [Lachnospiraceae bacterium]